MKIIKVSSVLVALMGAAGLVACQKSQEVITEIDGTFIELGKEIAISHCAACHNIDPSGISPRSDAPPLRDVFTIYNPTALADDFREHIHVGHPDMPDFDFTVKETEGLLAYLESIQKTPK